MRISDYLLSEFGQSIVMALLAFIIAIPIGLILGSVNQASEKTAVRTTTNYVVVVDCGRILDDPDTYYSLRKDGGPAFKDTLFGSPIAVKDFGSGCKATWTNEVHNWTSNGLNTKDMWADENQINQFLSYTGK